MDRKETVLYHIDPQGHGLEIGPSHQPMAPKKEGYRVHVLDHMDQAQLREKYQEHPVNLDNIEPVDFVWKDQSYADLTGKNKFYDWIIASHLIEHVPDLIGFLVECDTILKDDGVISLVIPDKRYCFDHHRPITGIGKIIDSHLNRDLIPTPGTVAEYCLNVVAKNEHLAWDAQTKGTCRFFHTLDYARQQMDVVIQTQKYVDVHAWCFVPSSFRLIIHDLFCLGFIPFQELGFFATQGCEFYVTLGRRGKGTDLSRMQMAEMIAAETCLQEVKQERRRFWNITFDKKGS